VADFVARTDANQRGAFELVQRARPRARDAGAVVMGGLASWTASRPRRSN